MIGGVLSERFKNRWLRVRTFPGWKDFPDAKLASTFLRRHGNTEMTGHLYGNNAVLVDPDGSPMPLMPQKQGQKRKTSLCVLCLDARWQRRPKPAPPSLSEFQFNEVDIMLASRCVCTLQSNTISCIFSPYMLSYIFEAWFM